MRNGWKIWKETVNDDKLNDNDNDHVSFDTD